jgi:hypothetical protein
MDRKVLLALAGSIRRFHHDDFAKAETLLGKGILVVAGQVNRLKSEALCQVLRVIRYGNEPSKHSIGRNQQMRQPLCSQKMI